MKRTGEFGGIPFNPREGNSLLGIQPHEISFEKEEREIIPAAPLEFYLTNGEPPSHAEIVALIEDNQRAISELRAQQASVPATEASPDSANI